MKQDLKQSLVTIMGTKGLTRPKEKSEEKSEEEEIMGRLAGRGTAPGGLLPSTGKNGGFDAPIEERAAEAAAVWRKYISRGEIPAPATRGAGNG